MWCPQEVCQPSATHESQISLIEVVSPWFMTAPILFCLINAFFATDHMLKPFTKTSCLLSLDFVHDMWLVQFDCNWHIWLHKPSQSTKIERMTQLAYQLIFMIKTSGIKNVKYIREWFILCLRKSLEPQIFSLCVQLMRFEVLRKCVDQKIWVMKKMENILKISSAGSDKTH